MSYRERWFRNNKSTFTGKYRCSHCGKKFRKKNIDIDHIVPKSRGGTNDLSNLQALCRYCNRSKGNNISESKRDVRKLGGLYGKVKVPKNTDKFCFVCNSKLSVFYSIDLEKSGFICRDCYKKLASGYRRQKFYLGTHLRDRLEMLNKYEIRAIIKRQKS